MTTEWRPDDWQEFIDRQTMANRSYEYESGIEVGASAMLAARDKWWITKGDEIFQMEPDCWSPTQDKDSTCAIQCPMNKCEYVQWQQLKKELEGQQ